MKFFDLIAAISTPVGQGGVAIVRISGENAQEIASRMVFANCKKDLTEFESHKLYLSKIKHSADDDTNSSVIDEALVVVMRAPHSYTGEDVVEIQCHGGYIVAKKILSEIIRLGARPADRGEFTRRAFMNGKIDLIRAEGIGELVSSTSHLGAENAAKAVTGKLSEKINSLRELALSLAAHISAVCDYPDEVDELSEEEIFSKLDKIEEGIDSLLSGFDTGKILREGIHTVIIGRPNVGKSSVLNALLGEEKAIVTDIPGTTRDIIEDYANLGGITLRIMDTAGIRQSEDTVEKIGIDRAFSNTQVADLCLFVLDSTREITSEDIEIFEKIKDKKYIIILNKSDLSKVYLPSEAARVLGADSTRIVTTAVPKGKDADTKELEDKIMDMFLSNNFDSSDVYITGERQRNALLRAKESIRNIKEEKLSSLMQDLIYVDLEDIVFALGEITGETVQDEIIDNVFKNFCVGK